MAYFPNVDPIYLFKRNSGEYILLEQVLTVKNARVILKEVPNHLSALTVKNGAGTLLTSVTTSPATSAEYQVDYTTGMVHFHSSNEGLAFTFNYSGTGMVNIGANRIIYNTSSTNNEDMTAQDILDKQGELDGRIETIENQITANEIVKQTEFNTYKNSTDAQLAENETELLDLMVNVRRFKTGSNTWNQALQDAVNYAGTLYTAQSETGGLYVPQNVTIKMPRGRYTITQEILGVDGLDFDFTGCTFIASPADKTIKFLNMEGSIFRNRYTKGSFVGFHTVLYMTTNNIDTSNLVWDSPTFQSCLYGIDTVSYANSRSTFIQITNIYSIKTDCPIKTHTDLTEINGGWIYHTGYNGAAIYNQGFTRMSNVICVPSAKQTGARPRWVDNYSEDAGSTGTLGERGIFIDHCRFGGEIGSCPVVFNYATHSTNMSSYKSTTISIENSYMTTIGSGEGSAIVLFALPNKISIKNVSGLIDLTNGLIKPDSTFDPDTIAFTKYINIDLDESTRHNYKRVHEKLDRFVKGYGNLSDAFRYTFEKELYGQQSCVTTADGKPKFTFKVNFADRLTLTSQKSKGMAFLLTISSGGGASYAYKNISTYLVHAVGVNVTGSQYELSFTLLKSTAGGLNRADTTTLFSLHWGSGDTGSTMLSLEPNTLASGEITAVLSGGVVSTAGVSIVPLFGIL